ncbi:MAG: hypothetical protein AAFQ07_16765, partial [Chloroflexota bacterium]
ERQRLGESVLMLLDTINHIKKSTILGRLSRAMLLGIISQDDFFILGEMLSKTLVSDLETLVLIYETDTDPETSTEKMAYSRLFNSGFLWEVPLPYRVLTNSSPKENDTSINKYGKLLVEIGIKNESST